ncbi:MAG: hypothetical protein EPO35_09215 [Acidobacteria bacterium]|nr:MAG: hypothetical protein EPO35_09215 [Acidobacteriota bacterium]
MQVCFGAIMLALVTWATLGAQAPAPQAATIAESSVEARFQLDVHVPDSALAALLPAGWAPNVAAQGAAKDANLRVIFIERIGIWGPNGRPLAPGSNRLVYLVAPVRDPAGVTAQMVIGGLTEDLADAPGPFGVYLPASTHTMQRSVSAGSGPIIETQDWVFAAAAGEHLEMHIAFERGIGNRGNPSETRFYSAQDPTVFQVARQEQSLEILRNVTTTPADRVREFSFKAGGGSYAKLFDGTEKLLS